MNTTERQQPELGSTGITAPAQPATPAMPPMIEQREREPRYTPAIEVTEHEVTVLETVVPRNVPGLPLVPPADDFRFYTLDARTTETIERLAAAVNRRQPCLLEGETAASKTSSIEFLGHLTRNPVVTMSIGPETDASDLIGKSVPNDGRLAARFEELLARRGSLTPRSQAILDQANGRALTLLESQQIAQAENLAVPEWRWQDGPLVRAMKEGHWLILDEFNLAESDVRARLNTVIGRNPRLVVQEHEGEMIGGEDLPVHPNFRLFATMNPASYDGRKTMSVAEKDRWLAYKFVPGPSEEGYRAMLEYAVFGRQPTITVRNQVYQAAPGEPAFAELSRIGNIEIFLGRLAKLQATLEAHCKNNDLGRNQDEPYIFTRRGLIEVLASLSADSLRDRQSGRTVRSLEDPARFAERAIRHYFSDRINGRDDLAKFQGLLETIRLTPDDLQQLLVPTSERAPTINQRTEQFAVGDVVQFVREPGRWYKIAAIKDDKTDLSPLDERQAEYHSVSIYEIERAGEQRVLPGHDGSEFLQAVRHYNAQVSGESFGPIKFRWSKDQTRLLLGDEQTRLPASFLQNPTAIVGTAGDFDTSRHEDEAALEALLARHRVLVQETRQGAVVHLLDEAGIPVPAQITRQVVKRRRKPRVRIKYVERPATNEPELGQEPPRNPIELVERGLELIGESEGRLIDPDEMVWQLAEDGSVVDLMLSPDYDAYPELIQDVPKTVEYVSGFGVQQGIDGLRRVLEGKAVTSVASNADGGWYLIIENPTKNPYLLSQQLGSE